MPRAAVSRLRAASPRQRRKVFEISLVRASMEALGEGRRVCLHCHRTPLIGETVYVAGDRVTCELCRSPRTDRAGQEEIVHSMERDLTVKRRSAA